MGLLGTHPGGVLAFSITKNGGMAAVTLGTTAAPIIGVNGGRQSIVFHNPASSGNVFVAPATNAAGGPLTPSNANPAGCFEIPPGATLVAGGECQCAWQGFAASPGSPLTIMESNV
jgi:hypothetical protein